ncbi:MAG: hypothetical protein U1D41_10160 [Nitrosomonas sp.]|uniref:hypothetical protein n=1 Tax=Nitrosomonas sp. TaxID=42353 RepID=UPI0027334C76|nr:hypothetical protein [Nitrosomonas sp.]MDP3662073.1 hypothetical protein [Nitrosomonas sp.]MDZ4106502.1 hypothetical protein [Nitrosomonas sp.]
MGYRFQNQCYETKQDFMNALSQTCTAPSGAAGLSSYFTVCTANTDDLTIQAYSLTNGTPQTPFTITPQLIACDYTPPFTNSDIIEISWLVVGVWVVAWGIKKMIEAIKK